MNKEALHSLEEGFDYIIGKRIRIARIMKDMTQAELGSRIGITLQQIQKYERAHNRVSASRLLSIAKALETDITYFFDHSWITNSENEKEVLKAFSSVLSSAVSPDKEDTFRRQLVQAQSTLSSALDAISILMPDKTQDALFAMEATND